MTQGRQRATKGDNFLINAKKARIRRHVSPLQIHRDRRGRCRCPADPVRRGDVAGGDQSSMRGPFRSGSMLQHSGGDPLQIRRGPGRTAGNFRIIWKK